MFAGMDVVTVPAWPTFPSQLVSVPGSGGRGPREQRPQERDSVLTGVTSCKRKLSRRPGYMWKNVEQRLSHPTPDGIYLYSQHTGKETKSRTDLSFDSSKQEKHRLNNKHTRENKYVDYQNTVSDQLSARSPVVADIIGAESVGHILGSNCQYSIDSQECSFYTGINTYSKHSLTGSPHKKDACLKQYKKERNTDISKSQAVTGPNKQVDSENFQRLQLWDIDKEIDSASTFISSFNFIQMSSNCNSTIIDNKDELQQNSFVLPLHNAELEMRCHDTNTFATDQLCSKSLWKDFDTNSLHACVGTKCGTDAKSEDRPQDYDLLSLDTDVCACSADTSDGSSAGSSVTSGYESSITILDQKCHSLMRKYEPILQDCLHENRMKLKLQTLILKLQKLLRNAVQNDDYEKADKYNKKLTELKKEQSSLKFQLPSHHPCIMMFLQNCELHLQVAEHQHNCFLNKNGGSYFLKSNEHGYSDLNPDKLPIFWSRRNQLIQDRQKLQKEIAEIKERLSLLEARDYQLSIEIEEGNRLLESHDCEFTSLPTTSASELHDLRKTLEDILPLRNKVLFNAELPEHIKRLQRKEQLLNMAIKTAAAKVCSSQKLCSNFSKKLSDIEKQLPTLLEAKVLAISGNEFSTAKDCAEEIKCLTSDKGRLEEIINNLQCLIVRNGQQLEAIKDDYNKLKTELEQKERLFVAENDQRENIIKYMEVLEDRLHSCRTHLFEKVWEADLETCQLFISGLHLKESSYGACEGEEYKAGENDEAIEDSFSDIKDTGDYFFPSKQDWQTIQLFVPEQKETDSNEVSVECFLSIKGSQSKVACKGSALKIEEQCENISDKLVRLEEQLQVALNNQDDSLTQYLQGETQMVKEALQAMLKQLLFLEEDTIEDFVVDVW